MILLQILIGCVEIVDVCNKLEKSSKRSGDENNITSPARLEGMITAFDGEDTLQNVFNDRQRGMDEDEVESLKTPATGPNQVAVVGKQSNII
tara:strand:- start:1605 stop:1880 length:276 start_codon:yes stop_codon:yes gene_type:complete